MILSIIWHYAHMRFQSFHLDLRWKKIWKKFENWSRRKCVMKGCDWLFCFMCGKLLKYLKIMEVSLEIQSIEIEYLTSKYLAIRFGISKNAITPKRILNSTDRIEFDIRKNVGKNWDRVIYYDFLDNHYLDNHFLDNHYQYELLAWFLIFLDLFWIHFDIFANYWCIV